MSSHPERGREKKSGQVIGFVGVGFDHPEGEVRITRSEHFFLVGGSQETHERMQETAIKFDEGLKRTGKPLPETPVEEVIELLHESEG